MPAVSAVGALAVAVTVANLARFLLLGAPSSVFRMAALAWAAWLALRLLVPGEAIDRTQLSRRRRVTIAASLWVAAVLVRSVVPGGDGLRARYFANASWAGSPAAIVAGRQVGTSQIARSWSHEPPAYFSVVWDGYLAITDGGSYRMSTTSDDGSWLYIDDRLVVDNGGAHGPATQSGDVRLTRGVHKLRLEFMELGGGFLFEPSWARDGGTSRPIPDWQLSISPTTGAQAIAGRGLDALLVLLAVGLVITGGIDAVVALGPSFRTRLRPAVTRLTAGYVSGPALAFSVAAYSAVLFVPQAGWNLLHTVTETTRLLRLATATSLSQFDRFQANLNTAHAGEAEVVPERVLTMVTLLDRYGIAHYGLSDGMAANNWVYQQMVASAWPRRLEPTAPDRFLLAGEPVPNGCRPIEQRSEVHLVRCP